MGSYKYKVRRTLMSRASKSQSIERVLADYGWTVDKPQINQQNIHPMFLSEIEELSKLAILHKQKSP
jgi:hypothetical protein